MPPFQLGVCACLLSAALNAQDPATAPETASARPAPQLDQASLSRNALRARLDAVVAGSSGLAERFALQPHASVPEATGELPMLEGVSFCSAGATRAREEARPAILFVANVEGNELFATEIALALAEKLAAGCADDVATLELLASTTLYILPCVNPLGLERRFASPLSEDMSARMGVDDDRDARQAEDPATDVDRDGRIAWMRWEDPEGEWMLDPTDQRGLRKPDHNLGERGGWKLAREGFDLDGDERVAEDGPFEALQERDFPAGWKQHAATSGPWPLSFPENEALADFVLTHRDLSLVVVLGARDELSKKPESGPDAEPRTAQGLNALYASDAGLIEELGRRYRELTGAKERPSAPREGSLSRWCYEHRGLWTLSIRPWAFPSEDAPAPKPAADEPQAAEQAAEAGAEQPAAQAEGAAQTAAESEAVTQDAPPDKHDKHAPKPGEEARQLAWIDHWGASESWRFLAWRPYQHPQLGAVEIGGFAPYGRIEPPLAERALLLDKELEHALTLPRLLARLELREVESEALGAGLYLVRAALVNDSFLPFSSRAARVAQSQRPARVRLVLPKGATLRGGRIETLVEELEGSGGRREFEWVVQSDGKTPLEVEFESDNAGRARRAAQETK